MRIWYAALRHECTYLGARADRRLADAIPKKRGPKTDVLEALLKRVNGLEKRLKDEQKTDGSEEAIVDDNNLGAGPAPGSKETAEHIDVTENEPPEAARQIPVAQQTEQTPVQHVQQLAADVQAVRPKATRTRSFHSAVPADGRDTNAFTEALLDTYFARIHGKPYYILDEAATRQRWRDGQLPRFVVKAIHAVSIRYASHLCGGHAGAVYSSQEYLAQARADIDVDEPSIDHVQTLLLLAMASFQNGKGKRSYMLMSHATSMALALSLHRELPTHLRIAPSEREGRRKLFWTCYLMDRFNTSGSKRPSLISDESIYLRLPAWQPSGSQMMMDGSFFPNGSSLSYAAGVFNAGQGSGAMLVEIVRVLGITNRYLAAGGVKGDSHFPWHTQSTLSKIRSELDYWAASTQDSFGSLEALFGQPDSSTLVLSKLIYHLIHCLIYRPFLPVDLTELTGTGQHQSWQIEATNLCFLHANAIAELVQIGKNTSIIDWPSFVGHCICTAGTIHVHGAHYMSLRHGDLFATSADFLNREMAQLADLRFVWSGVQHQRDTLQIVYASHSQLVKSLANNPIRYSPVFQMEDFFARYPGSYIDGAHVTFADLVVDAMHDTFPAFGNNTMQSREDLWSSSNSSHFGQTPLNPQQFAVPTIPTQYMTQNPMPSSHGPRRAKKRRTTSSSLPYPTPHNEALHNALEQTASYESSSIQPIPPQSQQPPPFSDATDHAHQPQQQSLAPPPPDQQTFTQNAFSPTFNFSPMPGPELSTYPAQTPSGLSAGGESAHTDPDKDPFLSLLEQLAENDAGAGANGNGMSDLDFFLNGQM